MNTYEVMKALEELIHQQEDSEKMVLPIVTAIESIYDYETIWIELVDGTKFSIHISRLKEHTNV